MASPIEAFKSLPPPVKFGIVGVGAAGAFVFYKKWKAAKAANASTSPNTMTVGTLPNTSNGIPGFDNGGGGGGIGGLMGQDNSGLTAQIQALQQAVQSLKDGQNGTLKTGSTSASLSPADQAALYNTTLRPQTSMSGSQFLSAGTQNNLPGNETPYLQENVTAPSGMVSTVAVPWNPSGSGSQLSGFGSLSNPLWQAYAAPYQAKYGVLPTPSTPASAFLGL